MRKPCFILIIFVLLAFGGSLAVPAEDVPETAYDESEGLPYEGTSLFPIVVPLAAARALRSSWSSFRFEHGVPSPFTPACVRDANANRATDARISLILLCTLLC